MNDVYFKIKDQCRKGLIHYLEQVLLKMPAFEKPDILDIGCGTGVPTLWLAENFQGKITAIDQDKDPLNYLQRKITEKGLQGRMKALCTSFNEYKGVSGVYDIILAEGFLNMVGFKAGFSRIIEILKKNGYLIIHDEYKDHEEKLEYIRENNCTVVDFLYLDEKIWWNDYYRQLEIEINKFSDPEITELFKHDIDEISAYKTNSSLFRSIYYLIRKN